MAKNAKKRTVAVPVDSVEANAVLARIGEIERSVADVEAAFAEEVKNLRADFDRRRAGLDQKYADITAGLEIFANQNRQSLLPDGKKTVELSAGKFGWRLNPLKVLHPRLKEETMIERIKSLGAEFAKKYIRTHEELNKSALGEDQPQIAGLKYSQKERFFYEAASAVNDEEAASNVVQLSQKAA